MDGLTALRGLFAGLLSAPLVTLFVLGFVIGKLGAPDPGSGLLVVAAALAGFAGALGWTRRPLEAPDAAALARSYRTSLLVAFAFAEAGLLLTLLLSFMEGELWPYLVGLPFFAAALAFVAPTERHLDRRQQDLMRAGSSLSLRDALRAASPRE